MHLRSAHYFLAGAFGIGVALAPAPTPGWSGEAEPAVRDPLISILSTTAPVGPPSVAEAEIASAPVVVRSPAALKTDRALEILRVAVRRQSHPEALRSAFEAYYNYREANPGAVRKPYLYYVDFGLGSTEPRGYVFDMEALAVVEGPFTVAHGRGSAGGPVGVPTRFSNRPGSNATSLGLYLTQETYGFSGKVGGRSYRSVGLRLEGLSGIFNSAARRRGVVAHGAPYVTGDRAGRSEGCPAMEPARAERLLPRIANGSLVFHFSPVDREWLRLEPWTRAELEYVTLLPTRAPVSSKGG